MSENVSSNEGHIQARIGIEDPIFQFQPAGSAYMTQHADFSKERHTGATMSESGDILSKIVVFCTDPIQGPAELLRGTFCRGPMTNTEILPRFV